MPETMLTKQYITKVETDDGERSVTAVISTGAVDRDKEVLTPKGAMLDNFMKNPVVLWAHDYGGEPIGKAVYIDKKRKGLVAKVEFAKTEKAENIYQLFKGGFLNAFSVGFIPTKSHSPVPDEIKKKPELAEASRVYDEWELLEFSAVPVPANPEALATAVKAKSVEIDDELKSELGVVEPEPELKEEIDEDVEIEIIKPEPVIVSAKVLRRPIKLVMTKVVARTYDKDEIVRRAKDVVKGRIITL